MAKENGMSEFTCINGHLMSSSWGKICKICGGRLHKMNGYTAQELKRMEDMHEMDSYDGYEEEE